MCAICVRMQVRDANTCIHMNVGTYICGGQRTIVRGLVSPSTTVSRDQTQILRPVQQVR